MELQQHLKASSKCQWLVACVPYKLVQGPRPHKIASVLVALQRQLSRILKFDQDVCNLSIWPVLHRKQTYFTETVFS